MGLFSKIKNGLKKTGAGFLEKVGSVLSSFKKIDEELFEELEETLILCAGNLFKVIILHHHSVVNDLIAILLFVFKFFTCFLCHRIPRYFSFR